jgi:ATP-binding protein involved in chromosome partitioning
MSVDENLVRSALAAVDDPQLHRSIVELGMVRRLSIRRKRVEVLVARLLPDSPTARLEADVRAALLGVPGVEDVRVELDDLDDDERSAIRRRLHGDPGSTAGRAPAHGHAEGRAVSFADPGSRTRVLLVASGKGGVGKSSVTVNLAISLARRGKRVAVVDADVWGFSIPAMLGIDAPPSVLDDSMIIPPQAHGISVASIGFFVREDQPVVWRGPMLHKALEQFLTDFYWGEPDYLVVDLPPGTGDISLSLAGFLPRSEAYVVTTPQPAAQRVAQRAGLMFQSPQVKIPVHGVIENMSWFTGDDGTRYELFGSGGGEGLAERLGAPLIGKVPLVPALREGGDVGTPIVVTEPEGEAATAFAEIARRIDEELAPTRRRHRDLKIV